MGRVHALVAVTSGLDTTVQMTFRLYKNDVEVWAELHPTVTATNGIFNVLLGSVTPLDTLDFDQPMDLGITVSPGNQFVIEMTPRTPLVAAAFALAVRGMHAVWVESVANTKSYNLIGGAPNNFAGPLAVGATISGGGGYVSGVPAPNSVTEIFGTVRYITTVDADGVALAAIQGLLERVLALEAEVSSLRPQLSK